MIKHGAIACLIGVLSPPVFANPDELAQLKQQLAKLQQQIQKIEENTQKAASIQKANKPAIQIGGAIRTNYSHTSYNDGNKNRGGDFDFDLFRVNFTGDIGNVELNAEIRFFDYMTAVKYAYVSYDFSPQWQLQTGITQVPFGNWPYNSHNYFFSTNYYLGLEDDHDLGILLKHRSSEHWQFDLGFFKNDELGGIDGYVSDRADRYSYDIVGFRYAHDGIYDSPSQPIGEYNTVAARYAHRFMHQSGSTTEIGLSTLFGGLHDGIERVGDSVTWAIHFNSTIGPWNIQLQHGEYDHDITGIERMAVGAYAFYDSIAAQATSTNANIAFNLPVTWGPINGLQFYNDFGIIYDKSDDSANTWMNVTGVSIAAGGLFTYVDLVHAKNQPFVGGSIAGNSQETERRFNINIGYYF